MNTKGLLLCGVLFFSLASSAVAEPVRFAAVGDTPYFKSELDNLSKTFALMGAQGIPFVIHVGDIFSGGIDCPSVRYEARAKVFSNTPMPFFVTIGDNEFNDCPNPIKARALFRKIILGHPSAHQVVKGTDPSFGSIRTSRQIEMIENVAWSYKSVDFIMLVLPALPGSYPLKPKKINEIIRANISFLTKGFKKAKINNQDAIVLMMHSDPAECNAYDCSDFNRRLIKEVHDFGKPVLLINGSDHDREFIESGYQGEPKWSRLRPGSEPMSWWPEITFSRKDKRFSVVWRDTPYWAE